MTCDLLKSVLRDRRDVKAYKSCLSLVMLSRFEWCPSAVRYEDTEGTSSSVLGNNVRPGTGETHSDGPGEAHWRCALILNVLLMLYCT